MPVGHAGVSDGIEGGVKPCLMKRPLGFQTIRLLLSNWLPPGLLGRVSISMGPGAEGGLLTTGIPDQGGRVWVGFASKLGLTPLLWLSEDLLGPLFCMVLLE